MELVTTHTRTFTAAIIPLAGIHTTCPHCAMKKLWMKHVNWYGMPQVEIKDSERVELSRVMFVYTDQN